MSSIKAAAVRRVTVHIHRVSDNYDMGHLVATVVVGDYKHPASNAMQVFIRDQRPESGKYIAFAMEHYGAPKLQSSVIFEVKYADAILIRHGGQEPVGGDFHYSSYAARSEPEWIEVTDRLKHQDSSAAA